MPAYRCLHCSGPVGPQPLAPKLCTCKRLLMITPEAAPPTLYIRPGTQYEPIPEAQ